MMYIPAASDLKGMADFLEANPRWSPILDENGVQIGVCSPWLPNGPWSLQKWLEETEDFRIDEP